MYALDTSANRSFQIAGAQQVYAACGIVSESSAADAFEMEGSETLYLENHAKVGVVGNAQLNGQTQLVDTISNAQVQATRVSSPGDPFASLPAPTSGTVVATNATYYDNNLPPVNNTIQPGVYCGGLVVGNTNGVTLKFNPGVYILAGGGLILNPGASVQGSGVTFYNTSSSGWNCPTPSIYVPVIIGGLVNANVSVPTSTPVVIFGPANATLSAPTSGTYAGILFFGNRTGCAIVGLCQDIINAGSTAILNGALYFKSDQITINSINASGYIELVADRILVNGNSDFGTTGNPIDGIAVSISPTSVTLYAGQKQQFSASVSGSNNAAVTWTLSSSSMGTISAAGLYTAPYSITAQQTITAIATSQTDSTKSGSATIYLSPPVSVAVAPATATVYASQTVQLISTVTNAANKAVTWTISPSGRGTISASGLYSAPSSITFAQTVTITATSQVDTTKSAAATISLSPPVSVSTTPTTSTLYGNQTQQFTASVINTNNTAVTWTISPSGAGTVSAVGLYTAPASVTSSQTVTVTATSQADTTKSSSSTVRLSPPVSVAVTPTNSTLSGGQTVQLTATVQNTTNSAVIWSIPSGSPGSVSASGLFTAPASTSSQQTVTVTATSQANPSVSASAVVTISSSVCISTTYSYNRAITIDHTKVPNTDQTKFPALFSFTDSALATTANGGHVTSPNGFDLIFSSDPSGASKLNFEIESYNPATGQLLAWVQIPNVSHITDTVLYLLYGNSAISSDQSNRAATWDTNYLAVLHLDETTGLTVLDSTANGNNGSKVSPSSPLPDASGYIGAAQFFNGSSDFVTLTPSMSAGLQVFSVSFWAQTLDTSNSNVYYTQPSFIGDATSGNGSGDFGVTTTSGYLSMWSGLSGDDSLLTTAKIKDNVWHRIDAVNNGASIALYLDGANTGQTLASGGTLDGYGWYLGAQHSQNGGAGSFHQGVIDELHVSSAVRSGDWITTEFNNQSSPSTFAKLFPENTIPLTPATVALYATQTLQVQALPLGTCTSALTWSISPAGLGTITQMGFYTAPANVTSTQTVAISASNSPSQVRPGVVSVILLPPTAAANLSLSAVAQPPYTTGSSQSFSAKLTDASGTPQTGVGVVFTDTGANAGTSEAVTNSQGIATYTETGVNNGSDTLQAEAAPNGQSVSSNSVMISWIPTVAATGQDTLTLTPAGPIPTLGLTGLAGAFTDNTGAVIEPVAIGASQKIFIVPSGATQFQLGVNDDIYGDNYGSGFLVDVNGVPYTVMPHTMPWVWVNGGLNSNLPFGVSDGSSPIVTATKLIPGQAVVVAYQSGTVSAGAGGFPLVNADGYLQEITGASLGNSGTHFATFYMFDQTEPVNQSVTYAALLQDDSANPIVGVPVTFTITGSNAQQLQGSTNASGNAVVTYFGQNAGADVIQAQSAPGGAALISNAATIIWTPLPNSAPTGSLQLTPASVAPQPAGGQLVFTVLAKDLSGNLLAGAGINVTISGADNRQIQVVSNAQGQAQFTYTNQNAGIATIQAVALISGTVVYSNNVTTTWTSPGPNGTGSATAITISIQSSPTVTLPTPFQLNATVTDSSLPAGSSPTLTWSQVAGPGTTTFANPALSSTAATFTSPGSYILQLTAADTVNSASAQAKVTVNAATGTTGWFGSPANGATVTGLVPITITPGISIVRGRLIYYPATDLYGSTPVVLNENVTGTGQIGVLDTTLLQNGAYYVQLQATDSAGQSQYSVALITVAGRYKPGRVTSTITDLIVPATGLAINIQRQYDSLNAATSSDFGFGWSLGTNVSLNVDPSYNVSFSLGGQRKTFYFTPDYQFFFAGYVGGYTPEPGLAGTLTAEQDETVCPFGYIVPNGSLWECGTGAAYSPLGYTYTDPAGTQYSISANGALQSIQDHVGNTLTVTPAGIVSSTGLSVPFTRDSMGRITQITDPKGNNYLYSYDNSGNLASVTYPGVSQPSTYTYTLGHLYTGGIDSRSNPLPTTVYTADGRLQSVTDAAGYTTSYSYDLAANTTTITNPPDANGKVGTQVLVYDGYGSVLSSTDPLGLTTTKTYDPSHNLASVTDPLGNTNSYSYDPLGNRTSSTYSKTPTSTNTTSTTAYNQYSEPTSTIDELGNVRTFTYDGNNLPQSVTDAQGTLASFIFNTNGIMQAGAIGFDLAASPTAASQFAYDAYGNMTSHTDALGRTTLYTYNTVGQQLTKTTPLQGALAGTPASTTTYGYDALGHLTSTAAPLGRTTSSTYDATGNKLSDIDPLGHITTYQYDALNRLTRTTYPTQPVTTSSKTYDFRNNVIDETDQAGHVTHHVYDLSGRQTSETTGFGTSIASTTTYAYYADGRKQSETDALGHTTAYTYDAAGNLTAMSGVKGNMTFAYDNARNKVASTDGNGNTTQYSYDGRKRLTTTTYQDGTSTTHTYDGPGNLASITDQAGKTIQYTYDTANQLQSVLQLAHPNTANNTNSYSYDDLGDLTTLTDENGHSTVNGFDLLSNPTTKTLPDGSLTETRSYDTAGNLVTLQHFNGKTTTYAYDQLNRLITRTPDPSLNEPTVSFTSTATGKRASMTDGSGTTSYTYDSLDRLSGKTTPAGTLNYTYDPAGRIASIISSNTHGSSVSYTYDSLNRLSTAIDGNLPAGKQTTTYSYDSASNVVTVTAPNGIVSTSHYDQLNRLTSLTSSVSSYAYQLLPTGDRSNSTEQSGRTMTWSYDGIYRLTGQTVAQDPAGTNGTASYSLDPVGNRLSTASTISGLLNASYTYNPDDETGAETYDANGNVLATGGKTFTYDSETRLTRMNGSAVAIVYDGDGNRAAETTNGVTTRYLVDDLNPTGYAQVIDEVVNGAAVREYALGLQRIDENQPISGTWTPSFYGYDGGGTVRQLTNLAGTVTDTYEHDAFGNLLASSGTTPNNYLYRGEQYDPTLGLYYLRARYYNTLAGRFMSRDPENGKPVDPKTLHKYLYAGGNPVNRIDPSGRGDLLEYAGNVADYVSYYNTGNSPHSFGKCQSAVYAGIAAVLENATESSESIIQALGPAGGKCVEGLLSGIISPIPSLP